MKVGHLYSDRAEKLLSKIVSEGLSDVILVHLSEECNKPGFARAAVERAMREAGFGHVNVRLTYADRVSDLVEYQAAPHGRH